MKVLVLGSVGKLGTEELKFGGREHAIAWKIKKDSSVDQVYCSPGNAGTRLNVSFKSFDELAENLSRSEDSWFVVPGPEKLFADGIVDKLREYDIPVPGPTRDQARLETSKLFAKKLMKENGIPTPDFKDFKDPHDASAYLVSEKEPLVLKADGLAAGKKSERCKHKGVRCCRKNKL
jgi:phosphoribosylamine--glycine ligase